LRRHREEGVELAQSGAGNRGRGSAEAGAYRSALAGGGGGGGGGHLPLSSAD